MRCAHAPFRCAARRRAQGQGIDRRRARQAGREGPPRRPPTRRRILQRIEVVETLEALAPCHVVVEAIIEELGAKQRAVPDLEKRWSPRLHPRLQHLLALGDGDGRGAASDPGARRRLPLLQSGAGDEDRRGGRRRAHRAVGHRGADRARHALRPHAGALQGHARLHRQPRRPRLRARIAARAVRKASPTSPPSTASWSRRRASASARSA